MQGLQEKLSKVELLNNDYKIVLGRLERLNRVLKVKYLKMASSDVCQDFDFFIEDDLNNILINTMREHYLKEKERLENELIKYIK